jgi:putative ABC transport system substrate-binding protein
MRRLGVLTPFAEDDLEGQIRIAAFKHELERLGWTEGRNLQIEYRRPAGEIEGLQKGQRSWWRARRMSS